MHVRHVLSNFRIWCFWFVMERRRRRGVMSVDSSVNFPASSSDPAAASPRLCGHHFVTLPFLPPPLRHAQSFSVTCDFILARSCPVQEMGKRWDESCSFWPQLLKTLTLFLMT